MDFEKIYIVGTHHKDMRDYSASQNVFADIVLIHRSQNSVTPLLYRLKKDIMSADQLDLDSLKYGAEHLANGLFVFVGKVESIDKKKKTVFLDDRTVVFYRHLIVASGIKQDVLGATEFSNALKALVDALIVQKIQAPFNVPLNPYYRGSKRKPNHVAILEKSEIHSSKNIDKIVHSHLPHEEGIHPSLVTNHLFDVHL